MKTKLISALFMSFILTAFFSSIAQAAGLTGERFVVSNLFKGNSTKGIEVDVTQFGLKNNVFSSVGSTIEVPAFITLYDIDVSESSISFDWVESDFSKKVSGVMPDDKHDRNYFIFDLEDKEITAVELDLEKSQLHPNSALPTVTLISPNKFMTEFAARVIRKAGFKPYFKITVAKK